MLLLAAPGDSSTQFGEPERTVGPQFDQSITSRYQMGLVVTAQNVPCQGLVGTAAVPMDWPEQDVKVVAEDFSPAVKSVTYKMIAPTVKQMVVSMPYIPAGDECQALVTLEITRRTTRPPPDTTIFVMPNLKKLKTEVRLHLPPSPQIESSHPQVKSLAKEITSAHEGAWQKVEAIFQWVRANIEYKNGPLKSTLQTLKDRWGDCEEMSGTFIALCRASDVPARIVWVPDHCYAEFYLEDQAGRGYWFPCQPAGNTENEFGGIQEKRPILQKGDNFQVPERPRERQRYVAEYLKGTGGQPKCRFVRELLPAP